MTTTYCVGDIAQDEGLRLKAYPDPRSPRAVELRKPLSQRCAGWEKLPGYPWTIGYGSTRNVKEGDICTVANATVRLMADIEMVKQDLDRHTPWWRQLDDVRQDVLVNMCFNLGWTKLSGFHRMLEAIDAHNYGKAADEILASAAAVELPARYNRLATQMRTGVR